MVHSEQLVFYEKLVISIHCHNITLITNYTGFNLTFSCRNLCKYPAAGSYFNMSVDYLMVVIYYNIMVFFYSLFCLTLIIIFEKFLNFEN